MLNFGNDDELSDDAKADLALFEAQLNICLRGAAKDSGDDKLWFKCCEYVCINLHSLVAQDRESAVKLSLKDPEWWENYLIKWTEVVLNCNDDLDKVAKIMKKAGKEYVDKISDIE